MNKTLSRIGLALSSTAVHSVVFVGSALAQRGNTLGPVPDIGGNPNSTSIRATILNVLQTVLNFMALLAVVMIVIAGIRYVFSQGEQEATDKARKTIVFAVIGLIIILLASAIVSFVTGVVSGASQ